VYDYLIKEGISSSQLRYKGYGSSYPAFSNKYKSGRASNRRIEVKIIQKRDYGTGTLVNESAYEDILLKLENIKYDEFKINQSYIMTNLNFESGKSELTDSNNKDLTGLLLFLNSNPNVTIEIGGFTDNSGMKEKNDTISQLRAQSVHSFLIQKGIATEKLDYIGYGSKNPISSNQQKWGRDKNRRIEIKIISK
jgi:outer membrane protein OmpA-like peptidoglycan-associated protein